MNLKKAFRKFGNALLTAPPGASLTIGLSWIEGKGWRVMMQVHTAVLMLGSQDARNLAATYDKHQREAAFVGLEWVAPELRKMADEADEKNAAKVLPPEMLEHIATEGSA